jgi:hypothetical protein
MNKKLLVFFLLIGSFSFAQNDTIRIIKTRNDIYKCQTKSAYSWYLHINNEHIALVDLKINPNDVNDWFKKFYNSQNIYKAKLPQGNSRQIYFRKDNYPLDVLIFDLKEISKERILMESLETKEVFVFEFFEI